MDHKVHMLCVCDLTSMPFFRFYPASFAVDMNGKRWPWEAVTLLPFIDSKKLIEASRTLIDESKLSEEEKELNKFGNAHVITRDGDSIHMETIEQSSWKNIEKDANIAFQPQLNPGTISPFGCFPTLKEAPIRRLNRRKIGINVFGLRSRYRTALLEIEDLPPLPPAHLIAKSFIGTTIYFRYPFLQEGFVCAVSDSKAIYRGQEKPKKLAGEALEQRKIDVSKMYKKGEAGAGMVGTGGLILPPTDITLCLRPLTGIQTLTDGTEAKVFAKFEVEVPFFAAIFTPTATDPRLDGLPARLEKNPYAYHTEKPSLGSIINTITAGIDADSGIYCNAIQPTKMSAGEIIYAMTLIIHTQKLTTVFHYSTSACNSSFFHHVNCTICNSSAALQCNQIFTCGHQSCTKR